MVWGGRAIAEYAGLLQGGVSLRVSLMGRDRGSVGRCIFPCYLGSMLLCWYNFGCGATVLFFLLAISGRGSEPMEVGL